MKQESRLSQADRRALLSVARQAIRAVVNHQALPIIAFEEYSPILAEVGASFVTLTLNGQLRGCIGTLEAYQPLVLDVQEHTVAAATQDYRFLPVKPEEVELIKIEISRLSAPQPLTYENETDLISKLRPGVDGVVIRDGIQRATFLPQVWEKLPDPQDFLTHLCQKMGAAGDQWKRKNLQVFTYQVEEFQED